MLASIHPLGERARHNRWERTAGAYLVGSVAGGAALGAALGGVGRLGWRLLGAGGLVGGHSSAVLALALAVVLMGLVAGALDLGLGGMSLPTVRRQVNEDWLHRYRGWVYGLGYGFQLGLGVVTIVTSAAVYLTFVLALLTGSVPAGAAVGATFGLVRGLPVLAAARMQRPEQLRVLHRRLQSWARAARGATVVVQGCLALGAVGLAALVLARPGAGW